MHAVQLACGKRRGCGIEPESRRRRNGAPSERSKSWRVRVLAARATILAFVVLVRLRAIEVNAVPGAGVGGFAPLLIRTAQEP